MIWPWMVTKEGIIWYSLCPVYIRIRSFCDLGFCWIIIRNTPAYMLFLGMKWMVSFPYQASTPWDGWASFACGNQNSECSSSYFWVRRVLTLFCFATYLLMSFVSNSSVYKSIRLYLDPGFGKGKGKGRWFNGPKRLDCLTFSFSLLFPSSNPWFKYSLNMGVPLYWSFIYWEMVRNGESCSSMDC